MDKTFPHKITLPQLAAITIFASLSCYWLAFGVNNFQKTCGIILFLLTLYSLQRALHTKYIITQNHNLIIHKGPLTPKKHIPIKNITSIQKIKPLWSTHEHIIIEINRKSISITPQNPDSFIKTLQHNL